MPYILSIETATDICSVSISNGTEIVFGRENKNGPSHATVLGPFVKEAMDFFKSAGKSPDAIAVSCGPGSYTGLRIGVSEAKGLCFGLSIPLIAINTLEIMAGSVVKHNLVEDKDALLCPMIDARRMEVYDAVFDQKLDMLRKTRADIIDEQSFGDLLSSNKMVFFGNGADKIKSILKNKNVIFVSSVYPQATDMADIAFEAYQRKDFVDVAYFEPFYLKEFVATVPKNKVLPPH